MRIAKSKTGSRRSRTSNAQIAQRFFENTVLLARILDLVSDEHFSVDGTLLEAWASHMSSPQQ